jgi:hypothetical protein
VCDKTAPAHKKQRTGSMQQRQYECGICRRTFQDRQGWLDHCTAKGH